MTDAEHAALEKMDELLHRMKRLEEQANAFGMALREFDRTLVELKQAQTKGRAQ